MLRNIVGRERGGGSREKKGSKNEVREGGRNGERYWISEDGIAGLVGLGLLTSQAVKITFLELLRVYANVRVCVCRKD